MTAGPPWTSLWKACFKGRPQAFSSMALNSTAASSGEASLMASAWLQVFEKSHTPFESPMCHPGGKDTYNLQTFESTQNFNAMQGTNAINYVSW